MPTFPYSFELFPPRTPEALAKLPATLAALAQAAPAYFSVTHGAGGSTQENTYETIIHVAEHTGVEVAPHLTCIASTRASIAEHLDRYRAAGVRRIVALRGDLPATAYTPAAPGEFHFANELVAFIRAEHGSHFHIAVAAYPEMHPQAPSPSVDFDHFQRKVDAGADSALTQLFYNPAAYFDFVNRCTKAGISIPIIPGIMPITGFANTVRFTAGCGADLPRWVRLRLEELQNDKQALIDFGHSVVADLCRTILAGGAPALHFYTINQSASVLRLLATLRD